MRMLLVALGLLGIGAVCAASPGGERASDHADHAMAPDAEDPDQGRDLVGRPAPEWSFDHWARGPARSLGSLRGKVVLVRWWTEGCNFCAHTLPALETLAHERAGSDLVVIGVYHPKPPRDVSDHHILAVAKRLGFSGPVAVDRDWKTLDRYWLDGHPERDWTSVSFLIDRQGAIRWVHGGGEYHPSSDPLHARCDASYGELEKAIAGALAAGADLPGP